MWSVNCNIPGNHTSKLLKILKNDSTLSHLPKDSRTLKGTPKEQNIRECGAGKFLKIGFEINFKYFIDHELLVGNKLTLDFGLDGVELFKDTNYDFWPILFNIVGFKPVFLYGAFYGLEKPHPDKLLKEFVDDLLVLQSNDFLYNGKRYKIKVRSFLCDALGKAYVMGIKYPRGYFSCSKCSIKGVNFNKRMVFLEDKEGQERTNIIFRQRTDNDHHNIKTAMVLEKLDIDIVKSFPVDYMHCVCLGLVKLIVKCLVVQRKHIFSMSKKVIEEIDRSIETIQFPIEFQRKTRKFSDFGQAKASECKNFLLYVGVSVLRSRIDPKYYHHFLKLSIAITILLHPTNCFTNNECARDLIRSFVDDFGDLYGFYNLGYNVHSLVHLADDVISLNSDLNDLSTFKFENFNMKFKDWVQNGKNVLAQIGNRYIENLKFGNKFSHSSSDYPEVSGKISSESFSKLNVKGFSISIFPPDNYVLINNKIVFEIDSITKNQSNISILGRSIKSLKNLYQFPIESCSIGTFVSPYPLDHGNREQFPIEKIFGKMFKIHNFHTNEVIFIKLVHS